MIAMRFLNASVLERKALNRNLSWGFPLGNLLPKTRVLKHRVLERKRRPNANASVLGTQRFRTLSAKETLFFAPGSGDVASVVVSKQSENWAFVPTVALPCLVCRSTPQSQGLHGDQQGTLSRMTFRNPTSSVCCRFFRF